MNWSNLGRKLLPHLIIIGIFLVVCFIFMAPVLKGKVLPQNDVKQWMGSFEEMRQYMDKTGERTLWTNSMFGGMPTYQISPQSDYSLVGIKYIYGVLVSGWSLPKPINSLFLYFFGFYLLLRAFRVNPWLSMIGALAYGLSTFNIVLIEAGHMLQTYALGSGPMVLAAAVYTLRTRKYIFGGALFAVALAINVRINHPQISYYLGLILVIYLISEFIYHLREKQLLPFFKAAGVFIIGLILAVGSTATFLITSAEYAKETIRGKSELTQEPGKESGGLDRDYAFQWSYGQGETFSILIPDFMGGGSGAIGEHNKSALSAVEDSQVKEIVSQFDEYWGDQPFTSGPFYFGAIICFFFVLGLFVVKGRDKWWILAATILSIILSWGKNFEGFNYFIFDHFPLYNKFRSVQFTLVMAAMMFPLLAMLAVDIIVRRLSWDANEKKQFYYAAAIAGGLCLLFYMAPSTAGDFLKPEKKMQGGVSESPDRLMLKQAGFPNEQIEPVIDGVVQARTAILRSDAGRSLLLIILAGGIVFLFITGRIRKEFVFGGLGVLVLFDLGGVDRRYLNEKTFVTKNTFQNTFVASEADNRILQDKDPDYRVLNLTVDPFSDATTSYFHKSVGGYHGAKLRRFQEMRERYLDQIVGMLQQNLKQIPGGQLMPMLQNSRELGTLNMMNTKYLINGSSASDVVVNPYALGHAWFVRGVRLVPNADAEIAALNRFNPADTAVVNSTQFGDYLKGFVPSPDPSATITLKDYRPNRLVYETNATTEQLAVFSEIYYDNKLGWDVFVDGKPDKHLRADYVLRAMRVPAGRHTIEFRFEPQSYALGEKITLISSLLLLLGFIGGIAYEVMQNRKKEGAMIAEA